MTEKKTGDYCGIPIINPSEADDVIKTKDVLLTVMYDRKELTDYLRRLGFTGKIIDVRELIDR